MQDEKIKSFLLKRVRYQEKCAELESEIEKEERNAEHWKKEGERIYAVLEDPEKIIMELSREFQTQTTLNKKDIAFLFFATALQVLRITIINNLTKIEKAGKNNRNEESLHNFQRTLFGKFDEGDVNIPEIKYYAAKKHILTRDNVPYDATAFMSEKYPLFKGANHRFATLGHDPVLGLIFGTANIMTNTITCVGNPVITGGINIPKITTNHVIYDGQYKNPQIGMYGSTPLMLKRAIERTIDDPSVLAIALIKQLLHIGTDLYTPCGIQIPAANLLVTNTNVEELTRVISMGDVIKIGASGAIADIINRLVTALHFLTYERKDGFSQELFSVKTRKIIIYSNTIATHSNILYSLLKPDVRALDVGGLIVTIHRIVQDRKLIEEIRDEFVYGGYEKEIKLRDICEEDE